MEHLKAVEYLKEANLREIESVRAENKKIENENIARMEVLKQSHAAQKKSALELLIKEHSESSKKQKKESEAHLESVQKSLREQFTRDSEAKKAQLIKEKEELEALL